MNENWVLLVETANDVEADIVCGFLREAGIPADKRDSSPYTGAMRVIGGLAPEVQVLVPAAFHDQAQKLLDDLD